MIKRIGEFFKKIWLNCKEFCIKIAKIIARYTKMFFQKATKHIFWMITMFVGFVVGLLLLILPIKWIVDFTYISIGLLIVVLGFVKIAKFRKGNIINYYDGTFHIILGILVMFSHKVITMVIVALLLIALPIYRIIRSKNKKLSLHQELVYLCLGLVIIFCGDFFAGAFVKILGAILLLLAIYLGYLLWIQDDLLDSKKRVIVEATNVVEVNSDEVIVDEKEA